MGSVFRASSFVAILSLASAVHIRSIEDRLIQSSEGGQKWTLIEGLPVLPATAVAVDPESPAIVYAGLRDEPLAHVYRRDELGRSWSLVLTTEAPFQPYGGPSEITSLVVDPVATRTVYASMISYAPLGLLTGGIFKTTDEGLSWSQLANTSGGGFTSMAIDPENPEALYAANLIRLSTGGFGDGMQSFDGGANWTDLGGGFPVNRVNAWAFDVLPGKTIYAGACGYVYGTTPGTREGVFSSTDGGATWGTKNQGLSDQCVLCLAKDPATPSALYVGTPSGVFKSVDGAASWNATGLSMDTTTLAVNPRHPAMIFAGTSEAGVFRSRDGGSTWTGLNEGLPNLEIRALAIDSAGARLYAATGAGAYQLEIARVTRVVPARD